MKRSISLLLPATLAGAVWLAGVPAQAVAQDSVSPAAAVTTETPPPALSPGVADVLKLSRAQIKDDTIVAFIGYTGKIYQLNSAEIIYLQQQGVSDRVLTTMLNQRAKLASVAPQTPVAAPGSAQQYAPAYAAPQTTYVQAAPTTTAASTVYVMPSSASLVAGYGYYPYYGPTYYGGYYGYPYPAVSLAVGFGGYYGGGYYGGCGYGWGGYRGGYCGPYNGGYYRGGYNGGNGYHGTYPSGGAHPVSYGGGAYRGGGVSGGGYSGGGFQSSGGGGGFRGGGGGGFAGGGARGGGGGGGRH